MSLTAAHTGAWTTLPFFRDDLPAIDAALDADPRPTLPDSGQVFAALELTQPEDVRVVILGQDPYPTPGHAHGLAFSAAPHVRPLPRSLANIYREMQDDLGAAPPNADLRFWARQGVLLLNSVLTVPAGTANGHKALGWQRLTAQVLARLADAPRAFLLWGRQAQEAARGIDGTRHLKIETPHPSPLSARRGFFGSRPFSRTNDWLRARGHAPINWTTPEAS
ncbi:uracil-DNA glycosylase [Tropicimonas isoalkanivorans]|uniref:Uracil-DNA glycosylase n=1 Tax=Tropicimonas isoalkanivorans TaxID=441112 RepID=A0A1I1DYH2_9RHOB|nr:uracil-DNA glycosylase [Tropicimonas isoalkanivorans]SFB80089.1 Uracil-DNA glycosylase [Tropicimonas isoalkanivorans]